MSRRDKLAQQAPITFEMALTACGVADDYRTEYLVRDSERSVLFAIWAMLAYEWADAMIAESEKR